MHNPSSRRQGVVCQRNGILCMAEINVDIFFLMNAFHIMLTMPNFFFFFYELKVSIKVFIGRMLHCY